MADIMDRYSGTDYDYSAFAYFSWRVILKKLFKIPFPTRNKLGKRKPPLCTGHAEPIEDIMPHWFSKPIKDFDLISPQELFFIMRDSGHFIDLSRSY
jgi:hypothetical protein